MIHFRPGASKEKPFYGGLIAFLFDAFKVKFKEFYFFYSALTPQVNIEEDDDEEITVAKKRRIATMLNDDEDDDWIKKKMTKTKTLQNYLW